MNAIRVQYTVREDFVETNQANIRAVMQELNEKGDVGVRYAAYLGADGKTFTHIVIMRDEAAKSVVPGLEAFVHFQAQLKTGVEVPPAAEDWTLVGSNIEV